jgi:hypothetical protein
MSVGKVGSGVRGSKGARTCGGGRRTRSRGRVHGEGRGREFGDGLTGGLHGTERAGARARRKAPKGLAHGATGGREGARGLAPTGETHLSDTEGTRARARGWACWVDWAEMGCSIFREFLMSFLFIFSRVFNSNSI